MRNVALIVIRVGVIIGFAGWLLALSPLIGMRLAFELTVGLQIVGIMIAVVGVVLRLYRMARRFDRSTRLRRKSVAPY